MGVHPSCLVQNGCLGRLAKTRDLTLIGGFRFLLSLRRLSSEMGEGVNGFLFDCSLKGRHPAVSPLQIPSSLIGGGPSMMEFDG